MKFITVRVTNEFDHRLRLVAAQMDMSRSRLIRLALREKLANLGRPESSAAGPDWAEYDFESGEASEGRVSSHHAAVVN